MDRIKFLRYYTEFGYFYRTDGSNIWLMALAHFLLTEVVCFGTVRLTRLINQLKEDGDCTSGNMIRIEKQGRYLYLGFVHDEEEDPFQDLKISKEELFKLMPVWEKLMKEKPEEILLAHEKGKFELIAQNPSEDVHA